ncbi:FkbM family methyltransferase [Apibacter adventoris]|uniref:Methyltransferase FkbM domain-containing protein n=1 Tax=Apibacter adventoris TaxID=1679466 RepID=A0A2S8AF17_9FLAO|nr:FkbM family methyltransferase [Apibacter adventoris]PQL94225.1 hypothetical protein C4S77_03420 [Apibacter adventoris]
MSRSLKELIPQSKKNKIIKFISDKRNKQPIKSVLQIAEYLTYAQNNVSYDSSSNGENLLFKKLAKHNFDIVVDCGANVGTNTRIYKIFNPKATIYAIEAIDETLSKCKEFTQQFKDIHYFNLALGSERSETIFKHFPTSHYLSTRYENNSDKNINYIEKKVEIYAGDQFCSENNISHINFLKIDVEGMDFEVIKGFKNMIKNNKIDAIQFEYGKNFIYSGSFLKDIYNFCIPNNYIIGKIYPNGVHFLDYNVKMENFLDSNFLIINKNFHNIIEEIKEK